MSSINQLVSEIAHSMRQADSVPVRIAIKRGIIHARNELIRQNYSNHRYTDKVLKQRYKVTLIDVPDGDIYGTANINSIAKIKRTANKVPRPTRIDNGIPFHSIRTTGVLNPIDICFVGEGLAKFYKHLPCMGCAPTYDYINEYVYFNNLSDAIKTVVIETAFEYPHEITVETSDNGVVTTPISDDDEFLLPEDMISSIKKLVLETFNPQVIRDTNETKDINLVK